MTGDDSRTQVYEIFHYYFDDDTIINALAYAECVAFQQECPVFSLEELMNEFSSEARRLANILLRKEELRDVSDLNQRAKNTLMHLRSLISAATGKRVVERGLQSADGNPDAVLIFEEQIEEIRKQLNDAMITIAAWRFYGAEIPKAVEEETQKISDWLKTVDIKGE